MLDDRLKLYTAREVKEIMNNPRKLYGSPYPFPHPRKQMAVNDDGKTKGIVTEHAVANLLNLLTYDYENLYVFHSVGMIGDGDGETDNILVHQNQLFLIEAKSLSNFESVSMDINGVMHGKRGDKKIALSGHNNLVQKLDAYKKRYPHMKVTAYYVVRQASRTGSEYSGVKVTTLEKLLMEMNNSLKQSRPPQQSVVPLLKETMGLCIRHEDIN